MLSGYRSLVVRVAEHLAGRPVNVRHQAPYIRGVGGLAFRSHSGFFIDIDPEVSDELALKLLCHEAAHIRLQAGEMPVSEVLGLDPNSHKFTPGTREKLLASPGESAAEQMGRDMYQFALDNAKRSPLAGSELEARLMALLQWREKRWRDIIESAAKKAVEDIRRNER